MSPSAHLATSTVETDTGNDFDSAFGGDLSTYTQTLRSSLLQSVIENGRGYHKFRDGLYILPEDEREQDRLDMQHDIFLRSFGQKLFLAPIGTESLHEVLDLGTGTGIWAIDFADQHPEANVLGVDLSPMQPTYIPPNCRFEVDDFDHPWTYPKKFDLIHGRMLLTSSADFPRLFQQSFDSLQGGGWLEMQDLYMPLLADDDSMEGTAWQRWNDLFSTACSRIGRSPSWTVQYREWMIATGFEDVQQHLFKWPVNPWPKDRAMKEMGKWNLINMLDGLDGFTLRLFSKALGMSVEEIEVFLADVRKDLQNPKIHSYWPV